MKTTRPMQRTLKQLNRAERTQAMLFAFEYRLNGFPVAVDSKLPIRDTPVKPLDYMRLFWEESEIRKFGSEFDFNIAVKLGETSLNTFVIDVDDQGRGIEAMTRLASHHIRTLTVKSPKKGYHFYFTCTDCAVASAKFSYGDIKGQGGYVLFPGSTVNGKPYSFIDASKPHTDTLQNLQALLNDVLGETIKLIPTTYGRGLQWFDTPAGTVLEQRGRFGIFYNEYLITPTPEGNRKNKLYQNTHYAIATGKPLDAVEAAAQRNGLPQSEINRTMAAAQRDHVQQSDSPVIGGQSWHWHAAMQFIDAYQDWSKGQHGNTERAVMLALVERARMDANEKGVFRASIREIKQLSQKNYTPAVSDALKRLVEKGLLIRVSGKRQRGLQDCAKAQPVNGRGDVTPPAPRDTRSISDKLQASHWKFGDCVVQNLHSRELRSQETDVSYCVGFAHFDFMRDKQRAELLERGSLGQTAIRVYAYLAANNGAPSQVVIAGALGIAPSTVGRALHKMAEDKYKLVEYVEDDRRWYAMPMADDEWAALAQQEIHTRGKSLYSERIERFGRERHVNLQNVYFKVLTRNQVYLDRLEKQALANDPLIAEAIVLGAADIERIA